MAIAGLTLRASIAGLTLRASDKACIMVAVNGEGGCIDAPP